MITKSTKLKRTTEMLLNGISVWVDLDLGGDCIFVCDKRTLDVTKGDKFTWVARNDLKPAHKQRSVISNKPKVLNDKEKTDKQLLEDFYSRIALRMPYNCENCGQALQAFNKFAKRSCCCHILEKSKFPSIACNEDNILFMGAGFLGGCNCHDIYDSNSKARSDMNVYQKVQYQFEKLKQYLTDKEIIKAETYLSIQYDNKND